MNWEKSRKMEPFLGEIAIYKSTNRVNAPFKYSEKNFLGIELLIEKELFKPKA